MKSTTTKLKSFFLCLFALVTLSSTTHADANEELLEAAKNGFTELVIAALLHGACVAHADAEGFTALKHAAYGTSSEHLAVAAHLLALGADCNHETKTNAPPIVWAYYNDAFETVALLLTQKNIIISDATLAKIQARSLAASPLRRRIAECSIAIVHALQHETIPEGLVTKAETLKIKYQQMLTLQQETDISPAELKLFWTLLAKINPAPPPAGREINSPCCLLL
jgi:hypothetical protein